MATQYWLMKTEPKVYSIDDLARDKKTYWDGVRNYQARNFMRDKMKKGDLVFFYHSNAEPPGIAGTAEIIKEGYPDPSAFDKKDVHYDPDSKSEKPVWYVVEIAFKEKFKELLPLDQLKGIAGLKNMPLLQRGQRLSVQPVSAAEWGVVTKIAGAKHG